VSSARPGRSNGASTNDELSELRARLAEAEEALRAVQRGEIDAVVVAGRRGPQVFTLEGTGNTYRVLIESMSEGALTLTSEGLILYSNERFARMVKTPLDRVQGASLLRFLSAGDREALAEVLGQPNGSGAKLQVRLLADDGTGMPVHISLRDVPLGRPGHGTKGVVVTDISDVRSAEEMLRAFTHFMVQSQDVERESVFGELHDNICQRLCGTLVRWRVLADKLQTSDQSLRDELQQVTGLLGEAAEQVRQLSSRLHAHGMGVVGLVPALRGAVAEFEDRTRIRVDLECRAATAPPAAGADVVLYRILQEALDNVERHARAGRVQVSLTQTADALQLQIRDDGVGFDPHANPAGPGAKRGFGLLGMRERVRSVEGSFQLSSRPGGGTRITVSVPLAAESLASA